MTSYRELVNMVLDELKEISDDSHIQKEHVIFLLDKYRGMLLKQLYEKQKQNIPSSNYQTICVTLEKVNSFDDELCAGDAYLKSVEEIPDTMSLAETRVSTENFFQTNISYVNSERFKYAGEDSMFRNFIYATIAPDNHLYLKSGNINSLYLEKAKVTGIFEDSAKASKMSCNKDDDSKCDVLDKEFPLEEGLIAQLINMVVKDLSNVVMSPKDSTNNAFDDMSNIYNYLRRIVKSPEKRKIDGDV